jgi:hypothetical protein
LATKKQKLLSIFNDSLHNFLSDVWNFISINQIVAEVKLKGKKLSAAAVAAIGECFCVWSEEIN